MDDCKDKPCALGAVCHDLVNDFECECPHGFTGKRCHIKEDLCHPNPCANGDCVDRLFDRECICHEGWTGTHCDQNIDECASAPCRNGGTCRDKENGYDCQCPPGFYGVQCQHQVNHCANAPCQNNATCLNQGAKYRCECPLGFEGTHCELEINECEEKDTCSPEGTEMCEDLINGFRCQCRHGFMGERCEIHQDQCLGEPCMNNASCIDLGSKFKCECKNGWKGERCDLEAGKCEDKPCKNEGHCVNLNDGDYFCVCAEGVSGKNCEHAPNRCIGNPCHNGGVCGDFGSKLECTCPKGFVGAGCEYELDACHHGLCQNGARCETVKNGGYKCHCPPGFTGQNCETEIDECSPHPCPINAKCIDQLNGYYCQCPFNMTGSGCDKQISTDYDLRFNDGVDAAKAAMSVPVPFSSGAFSLSLWIKFDEPHANGDVLTLYNSQTLNGPSNLTELLRVSATSCRLALFPDENPLTLHFPTNQRLNDGEWNNLIITWSAHEGAYSLVWNAIRLYADVGYGKNKQLNINAWINLGRPVDASDNDSKFVGSITRVHVWSRTLNFENDIPTIVQSCQDSPTLFSGLALHFANYDRLFGNVEKIVKSTCGRTDNQKMLLEKRNKDITIEKCPKDIFVVSPMKEVNVSWEEPVFSSMNTVDRVEKNFKNGQMFTFGEFQVLYVAYDNESNSAECSFKVHITREFCPDVQNPSHGQQFCEHWGPDLKYRACSIQCDSGFEFSEHPALFYTCAGDGSWRPRSADAFTFRYPQCSRRKPASRIVHLKINYPTVTICNIASTDTLSERLLQRIHQLHSKWKICADTSKDTCDGVNVKVQCMGEDWQRQKRETGETFGVRIDIPVQKVPVNDGKSGSRMDPMEVIQNEVFNKDLLNLEHLLPNGRPDLNSFRLDEEFRCKLGEVNVKDSCVACASGSFYDQKTQSCIQCPAGQYQPNEGQLSCLTCPGNGVTTSPGAVSSEECKPRCDAGYSLELHNGQCEPCGLGFYQPFEGSFECVPCGVGKTTLKTTSRSEEDCRDECPDGEHLTLSGACQPCPLGAYRTKGLHKQCVECPAGTTTEKVKSVRRADCNTPRCDPGQFLVTATKKCQFCPRGTFQDQPLQSTCKICPTDYTTAASGATHESQCYSTNQCATGENNCSWHAVCIDLPDDNDVPSFECKCKPGFRGNGTVCTDACLNFCLNDGICKKNNLGYVECNCKENFSGERCEIRFQPRTQKIMHATLCIGFLVFLAIVIIVAVWGIRQRFKKDDVGSIHKPVIPSMDPLDPRVNFMYANPRRSASSGGGSVRPIGFYYEDDNQPDSNEVKTMFVEETTTVVERPQPPTEEPPQETQVERFAWPAQNETNSSNNNVQNTNTEPTNVYQSRYTTSYDNDRFAAMRRHFYENRQS
ncbi:unnamed protein product [Bursaphelenchus xylophilus]|uniref:(pine wood nematode) hypothetical protein n=1 Tax=Bursaphelenchus xylophilus TaxID=6326 RepID=A0A1I7S4C7_BURXY|nr:unnamed protein product [Bursaphelenchus xylophilus]CAG9116959.1 unnamed protein product [Bursaphelenchus xylophilus]